MRISNNIFAMNARRLLQGTDNCMMKSLEKLSSGMRINRAADDAASLPISEKLRNQVSGLKQAIRNAQDGISMVQIAEGALIETQTVLNRMRNLAVQAGNGTLKDDDRAKLNEEFTALQAEINRIAGTTEFNTKKLLDGSLNNGITFQVNANTNSNQTIAFVLPASTTEALGVQAIALNHQEEAINALDDIDTAINMISATRSTLGAIQNQLQHAINNLGVSAENVASSASRIRDADMADELRSFSKNQILTHSATAMLAQANAKPQNVMKIVG
ncbi:MAG: flagellin [Bacillota bacterium]|jgi:flagellin